VRLRSDVLAEQSLQNFRAVFAAYGFPLLIPVHMLPDRTLFRWNDVFLHYLSNAQHKTVPDFPAFERWDAVQNHGATARYGWRESCARYSMQVVAHPENLIEIDIDLWNPNYGVAPAMGHWVEVMFGGRTSPYAVRKGLLKRGIEVPLVEV